MQDYRLGYCWIFKTFFVTLIHQTITAMKTKANPQAVINNIERRNKIEAYVAFALASITIIVSVIFI